MNSTELVHTLLPGEQLGEAFSIPGQGSQPYDVYPVIRAEADSGSNTVLIDVPHSTEVVHVAGDIAMRVVAVRGSGEVVILKPDGQREIHDLSAGSGTVSLGQGDTYYYLATSSGERLTVRDTCAPPFQPPDEVSLPSQPDSLAGGDYLFAWSPRHPGNKQAAGALRLAILEEHDTVAYNRAHADQPKFHGQPSHWHALAQRVGEEEIWPVNVRFAGQGLEVAPHRSTPDSLLGRPPDLSVQPDAVLFKGAWQSSEAADA